VLPHIAQNYLAAGDGSFDRWHAPDLLFCHAGSERRPDPGDERAVLPHHQDDLPTHGSPGPERSQRGLRLGGGGNDPARRQPLDRGPTSRQKDGPTLPGLSPRDWRKTFLNTTPAETISTKDKTTTPKGLQCNRRGDMTVPSNKGRPVCLGRTATD